MLRARKRNWRPRKGTTETLEPRLLLAADLAVAAQPGTVEYAQELSSVAPANAPLMLHSLPGAPAKVFLDFDGNFENSWGGNRNIITPTFDRDGNPSQFSADEQRRIHETWARVAEDFAPFNIDVTTEDPSDAKTQLRQAVSISQRTRTFYFRQQFNVDDASAYTELTLGIIRDDGAAVYLNGVEVVRDNLAAGAAYDDFAANSVSGGDESTLQTFIIDATLLVDGENTLAVEVHQSSDTSSDVSFDLELSANPPSIPSNVGDDLLVELGSRWRYLDNGTDQAEAWRSSDFVDTNWPVGQAEFGYGDGDEASLLRLRPEGQGRTRTFYFRHEFDVADPSIYQDLIVGLLRDDGAAVYLNGEEIVRDNLGRNAAFDDFALSTANNNEESTFFESTISADLLRVGRNVLAVEVHQVSDSSSDVSFDLTLSSPEAGEGEAIVPSGANWKYLDDGTDQGTAWRAFEFNDQSWPTGASQFGYGDAPGTVHVAIGSEDWFEASAGGVAFLNSFDSDDRAVVFTFTNGIGNSPKNIAEVSSHESGHAFGLQHQSVYDPETGEKTEEYSPGEGDWAPIMGNSYSPSLTTWHDGPVGSQGLPQDDMAVLARNANGFGYRDDDHGNDMLTATPLTSNQSSKITQSGIIERNSDEDVFSFQMEVGQNSIDLRVDGADFGANLDAVLEIRDQAGQVVASDDPTNSYDAAVVAQLEPGEYTAIVRSNGIYGRVGQYTLTGEIDEPTRSIDLTQIPITTNVGISEAITGRINVRDDLDSFQLEVPQGDFLTAIATPISPRSTLTINLSDDAGTTIQGERGEPVVFPLTQIENQGTYQFDIAGTLATSYTIQFGTNIVFEATDSTAEAPLPLRNPSASETARGEASLPIETTDLVTRQAVWQYLDDGSDQADRWRSSDFDASDWSAGPAELGYGDNDERTDLAENGADGIRNRTFYFRHAFEVDEITDRSELMLEMKFDDGMAVYLNGQEVARENLAATAGYRDFATGAIDNEGLYRQYPIRSDALQIGTNILAIEVHQASDTSSDVSLDASLQISQQRADSDAFEVEITADQVGQPLQVRAYGLETSLLGQSMEISTGAGTPVSAAVIDGITGQYDLGLDWTPTETGLFQVHLASNIPGGYIIDVGRLASGKPGDTNSDGQVDFADFLILSAAFGQEGTRADGDFDGDGLIGFSDFLLLSSNFGS